MEMIKFYQTATEYLFSKLPLAKKHLESPGITASTATLKLNVGFKPLYELSRRCHRSSIKEKNQPTDRRISGSSDPRKLVSRGWFIQVSTD